ncbi:hypothetical protein [Alteromonas oceanisediminis]|uniref:hypothetical protein n=1 Tax=Alteromonas oceanisediminis TaxID=2836180 RepID=UPI001BD9326A|nr:hypothetical protein [Alteromonas oceanisediminis]MBT0585351.1 hypothetical protein [Alteromonas oceanisediminis]
MDSIKLISLVSFCLLSTPGQAYCLHYNVTVSVNTYCQLGFRVHNLTLSHYGMEAIDRHMTNRHEVQNDFLERILPVEHATKIRCVLNGNRELISAEIFSKDPLGFKHDDTAEVLTVKDGRLPKQFTHDVGFNICY